MKRKNLLKKISLGAVGVASIGAIAFGVSKIVQFCKNDSKTLSLDYSVGALTDEGKYQEDECKLYTKKAFACEGLRVTFDFDAEVNGQFYFYDINDKYLSKSDVVTEGSSVSVPLNGAYARAVVIPTNDEDGSISFTEKYKYGSQMQVKVDKKAESNISNKFKNLGGYLFEATNNFSDVSFKIGKFIPDSLTLENISDWCYTGESLFICKGYKNVSVNVGDLSSIKFVNINFYDNNLNYLGSENVADNDLLSSNISRNVFKNAYYTTINVWFSDNNPVISQKINNVFTFSK